MIWINQKFDEYGNSFPTQVDRQRFRSLLLDALGAEGLKELEMTIAESLNTKCISAYWILEHKNYSTVYLSHFLGMGGKEFIRAKQLIAK